MIYKPGIHELFLNVLKYRIQYFHI